MGASSRRSRRGRYYRYCDCTGWWGRQHTYGDANINSNANAYINAYTDTYIDSNANAYIDAYADTYIDSNANAYIDAYADTYTRTNYYADADN
jgi:hypothetical protein